jgi:hypothetical protein
MNLNTRKMTGINKSVIVAFILLAGIAMLVSCEKYSYIVETVSPEDTIYFQADLQPVFNDNCILCHNASRIPDLRDGYSYHSLSTNGLITPADSTCRLYTQINSGHPSASFSSVDRQKIFIWIKQGAKNN